VSRQRAHFTLRHRIDGSVIWPHDQAVPLILADLELGDGGSCRSTPQGIVISTGYCEMRRCAPNQ
jgi:hypothetical protein